MSTNVLFAIYIIIAVIGILATVLGIINWIMYSSTSSTINELNDEIEKKGREFDSFKGSIGNTQVSQSQLANFQPPQPLSEELQETASINPQPYEKQIPQSVIQEEVNMERNEMQEDKTPQIDIVRNVRAEYEQPTSGVMKRETVIMKIEDTTENEDLSESEEQTENIAEDTSKIQNIPDISSETSIEISGDTIIDNPKSDQHVFDDFSLKRNNMRENTNISSSDEVMDIISEPEDPNKIGNDEIHGITIPLFSKAQNDADFNAMWQKIQQILEDAVIPVQINIDFSDIFFLYKEEIGYLKKIYDNVKNKNCTLGFINCSPELVKIIWEDNELSNLILDI